jgi:uncharacterized spore protein YtfJ
MPWIARLRASIARDPSGGKSLSGAFSQAAEGKEGRVVDIRELLDKMAENLSARRSFGAAYERDGALIIPVVLVACGGGGGEGPIKPAATKRTPAIETVAPANESPPDSQTPTGTGGGFGGLILPVGVYVVKDDQVRWVPAYDATLIVLMGLSVVRALVSLMKHGRRRNRVLTKT